MWVWLDGVGPILFDAALSTAVFLTLVVVAVLVCRQPSRRRLIARVALLASLAMVPLVALAPLPRLDLVDALIQSNFLPPFLIVDPAQSDSPGSPTTALQRPATRQLSRYLHDAVTRPGRWLPRSLALADLAIVGTGLAWLLLGFWGVRWLRRHSAEPSASTTDLFDRLIAGGPTAGASPTLRVASRVQHPVVVGVLRPMILIPPSYDEPDTDPELLRLSLLHEIAHAEQSDLWFGTVASLAQIIWFFLPHIWWLRSQLIIDQEFLADRSAALRYGTSSGYAASLLALAESRHDSVLHERSNEHGATWPAGGKDAGSQLFQRMLMLLHCPFRVEARAPRSWSWTSRVTVVGASIVAACLCIRWPDARALEKRFKREMAPLSQPFRVADFVAEPIVFLPGGRALPYIMPVALPSRFELSVEILASTSDLAKVHVAGHPLGADHLWPELSDQTPSSSNVAESWHQVRLERHGREVSLWVDGRKLPATIHSEATSEWLTFEPSPERPSHFRNLVVDW